MVPKSVYKHYKVAPSPHRETMLEMRKRILQIVPKAEEVVSYGMPAFKVDGNIVAGLLANKNHVGYYPFSGSVLHLFKKELANFKQTKSAIHVPIDKPLSKTLLAKLIKARISQCPVKQGKVDLNNYEKLDGYWKTLGLAAPAGCRHDTLACPKKIQFEQWSAKVPKACPSIRRQLRNAVRVPCMRAMGAVS